MFTSQFWISWIFAELWLPFRTFQIQLSIVVLIFGWSTAESQLSILSQLRIWIGSTFHGQIRILTYCQNNFKIDKPIFVKIVKIPNNSGFLWFLPISDFCESLFWFLNSVSTQSTHNFVSAENLNRFNFSQTKSDFNLPTKSKFLICI